MITIEQDDIRALEGMARAVGERKSRRAQVERAQHGVVGDPPQGEDRLEARQGADRSAKVGPTCSDFRGRRLVLRGNASHRVDDRTVAQDEPVVGAPLVDAARETEIEQRRIEEIAGVIAGERTSRAIGAA
jgi:hypothetical protein